MNKPKEVRTGLLLLYLSMSLAVIRSFFDFFSHAEMRPANISPTANLTGIGAVSTIGFILIYQISKAQNWARILFTMLVALSCTGLPFTLKALAESGLTYPVSQALGLAQVLIQVGGVGLLYRPSARRYFRGEPEALETGQIG